MEIFLLIADDIDDRLHALRMGLPKLFGFFIALCIFAATVLAVIRWPWIVASGTLLLALIFAVRTVPRDQLGLRFKTDP